MPVLQELIVTEAFGQGIKGRYEKNLRHASTVSQAGIQTVCHCLLTLKFFTLALFLRSCNIVKLQFPKRSAGKLVSQGLSGLYRVSS